MSGKYSEKIVLLLTGSVHVFNKHYTALNDPEERKKQYIEVIKYYLDKFSFPVVFVENSNEDLSGPFVQEIASGRLEIICFDGNNYSPELGKGPGEWACIEKAVSKSKFITEDSFVFKITGRYKILNLHRFVKFKQQHPNLELFADLTNNFRLSASAVFGFKPFFVLNYLSKTVVNMNDKNGYYFEHGLAKAVLEAIGDRIEFSIFKNYPRVSAISGTTGKAYKSSFLYMFPRQIKYWLRYLIVTR